MSISFCKKFPKNIRKDVITISIKRKRLEAGMNQTDLAGAVGVLTSTVSAWERGISKPQPRNLKKIAGALNCTIAELLEAER